MLLATSKILLEVEKKQLVKSERTCHSKGFQCAGDWCSTSKSKEGAKRMSKSWGSWQCCANLEDLNPFVLFDPLLQDSIWEDLPAKVRVAVHWTTYGPPIDRTWYAIHFNELCRFSQLRGTVASNQRPRHRLVWNALGWFWRTILYSDSKLI